MANLSGVSFRETLVPPLGNAPALRRLLWARGLGGVLRWQFSDPNLGPRALCYPAIRARLTRTQGVSYSLSGWQQAPLDLDPDGGRIAVFGGVLGIDLT